MFLFFFFLSETRSDTMITFSPVSRNGRTLDAFVFEYGG